MTKTEQRIYYEITDYLVHVVAVHYLHETNRSSYAIAIENLPTIQDSTSAAKVNRELSLLNRELSLLDIRGRFNTINDINNCVHLTLHINAPHWFALNAHRAIAASSNATYVQQLRILLNIALN